MCVVLVLSLFGAGGPARHQPSAAAGADSTGQPFPSAAVAATDGMTAEEMKADGAPLEGVDITPKRDEGVLKVPSGCGGRCLLLGGGGVLALCRALRSGLRAGASFGFLPTRSGRAVTGPLGAEWSRSPHGYTSAAALKAAVWAYAGAACVRGYPWELGTRSPRFP